MIRASALLVSISFWVPIVSAAQLPGAGTKPARATVLQPAEFVVGPSVLVGNVEGGGLGLGAEFEYGLTQSAGVGRGTIGVGFRVHTYSFTFQELGQNSVRITPFAIAANYHFPVSTPKVDPFVGVALGYATASIEGETLHGSENTGVYAMLEGGGRYFITPKMAVQAGLSVGSRGDVGLFRLGAMFRP